MIESGYWPRHPWPIIALDEEGPTQISRNLEQFFHFWHKKQSFPPYAPHHVALAFARGLQIKKIFAFLDFHENLCLPTYGQEVLVDFEPSKGQETLK